METGKVYEVDGFRYVWNGLYYEVKKAGEGDELWKMINTESGHMDVIRFLEMDCVEEEEY